jgi:hypothetical protein
VAGAQVTGLAIAPAAQDTLKNLFGGLLLAMDRVYFSDLNPDSLNLLVVYWFHPPDAWSSVDFSHRFNMQIMERFNAEGIDFAFPSQTMYLGGDSKRPINLGQPLPAQTKAAAPASAEVSSRACGAKSGQADTLVTSRGASIEEELLHGEHQSDAGDAEGSSS